MMVTRSAETVFFVPMVAAGPCGPTGVMVIVPVNGIGTPGPGESVYVNVKGAPGSG